MACALGILIALALLGLLPWALALAPLGVWVLGLVGPRLVTGRWFWISPATMGASLVIPFAVHAAHPATAYQVLSVAMVALILERHKNNLRRLLAGTEPRLGERATTPLAREHSPRLQGEGPSKRRRNPRPNVRLEAHR